MTFLPRDASITRGLSRHAVSVRPSVRPSRSSWIMSKRINISSKFFDRRVATPFYTVSTVHVKRCHWLFHNNFYKYARICMILGTQLVNLLRCLPCTSLTWWRNIDVTEIMPFTVRVTMHVTLSPCCRERRQILSIQRCGRSIRQIWIRWTTASGVGYFSKKGLPFADPWCEGVEITSALLREWRLLDHTIIMAAIAQWRSRLNARVRMNGGHFEHKFWASDLLLCFVCFIDTGYPKCNRYKHVQSDCVKCVTFVSDTFTRYDINECVAGNSYASDIGILWRSCARKIMKIRQYL